MSWPLESHMGLMCTQQQVSLFLKLDNLPESNDLSMGLTELLILLDDIGGHRCDDLLVLGVLVRVHVDEVVQEDPLGIEAFLHALPLGLQ